MHPPHSRIWWSFFFRGVIAILFGLTALLLPTVTIEILVILVGAFFFADGVLSIIGSFASKEVETSWWVSLLEGLAGISIGILTFIWPSATLVAIILLIAIWALLTGALEIIAAIRLRKHIRGEWFLGLSGIISILFGSILLARPGVGAVALVWIIGAYAIFFGILMIFLGFKLKKPLPEQ